MANIVQHRESAPSPPNPAPATGTLWRCFNAIARLIRRIGLEGKIVTALLMLITATMGATSWVWASQINAQVTDILGEQARQIAYTLSLAAKPAMMANNPGDLRNIGRDLLKTRNVLFVAFYDAAGNSIALSDQASDTADASPTFLKADVASLTQVRSGISPEMGRYLQVCAPVLEFSSEGTGSSRLIGYVSVGVSPVREQMQVRRVNFFAAGVGGIMALVSLPLAYLLVHQIFRPIRQLVGATHRIAMGQLDAEVAIHRLDAIGDLARAFNEMVRTVKRHQQDLRDANQLLEHANADLEQKVTRRTAQLATANNRLTSEIAEKEDFLRAVSHDLNAPLRNISGMASMLLMKHREQFDGDVVHRLERIQKNVEAETDLINELLELSRIKTRRQQMEMVEIGALVRALGDIFENDLKSRQITLAIDTDLPVLHGERPRFRQVFQNLIDNAIKYMGDGTVREIHVGCVLGTSEAEFYVRDTGLGIEREDQDKIFFVFRRGRNSALRKITGKGVGLSSVKSIIETYAGTIWVESAPGQGSTFKFTINGQYVPALQGRTPAVAEKPAV